MTSTTYKGWTLRLSDPIYTTGGKYRAWLGSPAGNLVGHGAGDEILATLDNAESNYRESCTTLGGDHSADWFIVSQLVAVSRFHPVVRHRLLDLLQQRPALTREQLIPEGERLFQELSRE